MEKLIKVIFLEDSKGIIKTNNSIGNIFFLSDEPIKEGDWVYNIETKVVYPLTLQRGGSLEKAKQFHKKIIATTDKLKINLYDLTGKVNDYDFLPQPSQSFIEKYVEEYNKGNVITDVLVEYEPSMKLHKGENPDESYPFGYDELVLKVNPKDNTITIRSIKDTWSREEVSKLLYTLASDLGSKIECLLLPDKKTLQISNQDLYKWIEENL